jgi:hypothetical protein
LLTNNPDKAAAVAKALADEDLEICRTEPIQGPISAFNSDYLSAKYESGHALDRPAGNEGALPPEPARILSPVVLPGEPNRILTASYFLPIALPSSSTEVRSDSVIDWFRLSVIFDCDTAQESIVLAHSLSTLADGVANALETVESDERITMTLFDRLPVTSAPGRDALTRALLVIRSRGRGSVAVRFDDRERAER